MFTDCGIMHRRSCLLVTSRQLLRCIELIEITNKLLLLHLVGCLYYYTTDAVYISTLRRSMLLLHSGQSGILKQWRTQEFCSGWFTNSVPDRGQRERGSGGGSPLVKGSGGSCNLVQEISYHIVKVS